MTSWRSAVRVSYIPSVILMDQSSKDLSNLRQTFAKVLACAVVELYPGAVLLQGEATVRGFYYDFLFPFPFQKEFLALIEEKMRMLVREDRNMRILEMHPKNAAELFSYHGQPVKAERVREVKAPLAPIFQWGKFHDIAPKDFLDANFSKAHFRLLDAYSAASLEGKNVIRIEGVVFFEKENLKIYLKNRPKDDRKDHQKLLQELDWFSPSQEIPGSWIWHPKADSFRRILLTLWQNLHEKQNFHFLSTPYKALLQEDGDMGSQVTEGHVEYLLKSGRAKAEANLAEVAYVQGASARPLSEGMFTPSEYFLDLAHLIREREDLLKECISSLQFIIKIPKILRFEFQLVLCVANARTQKQARLWKQGIDLLREALHSCGIEYQTEKRDAAENGPRIEVRLADALGRMWAGPFLRFDCHFTEMLGQPILVRSAFGPWERWTALIVERARGSLPLEELIGKLTELNKGKDSEFEN